MPRVLRAILVPAIATILASPAGAQGGASAPRDSAGPIAAFLAAYRGGDCATFRAFVAASYSAKVLASTERVEQFVTSFVSLKEDFGPLEPVSVSFDTTYKSVRHHLYGPTIEQWVTMMFVLDSTGKARGHGLWRRDGPPGWKAPRDERPLATRLRQHLRRIGDAGLFSGAVLLAGPGGAMLQEAYGTADGRRRLTTNDRFPIASISKMFTAAVILTLEEEGRLALGDPIAKHLPEYPKDIGDQVTIRHLLQHTSGIELDDNPTFNAARDTACTLDQALAVQVALIDSMNEGRRKDFRPLNRHDYSNENYDLLGVIAERVAKEPFDRLLAKRVLEPAGMCATSFAGEPGLHARTHRGRAGQTCVPEEVVHAGRRQCPEPAGGLFSTTQDLARFLSWLRSPRSGRGSLMDRMISEPVPSGDGAGYGFGVEILPDQRAAGHNGGIAGASSELRWLAGGGLTLVVLCNRERAAPDLLHYVLEGAGR